MSSHLKTLLPSELDAEEIKTSVSVLLSGHLWDVERLLLYISEKTALLEDTSVILDLDVFPCRWKESLLMQFWKKLIGFTQTSISLWLAFRWGCRYVLQEMLVCAFSVYFHYVMCSALGSERQKWFFGRFLNTCKFISLSWEGNRTDYCFITQSFEWTGVKRLPSSFKQKISLLLLCLEQVWKDFQNQFSQRKFCLTKKPCFKTECCLWWKVRS